MRKRKFWVLVKWLTTRKTAKHEWVEVEAKTELEAASIATHMHDGDLDAQPVLTIAQTQSHEYTKADIDAAVERHEGRRAEEAKQARRAESEESESDG